MRFRYISAGSFFLFIKDLVKFRNLIFEMAKKDFRNRFLGSYLGIVWGFVQPLITILIMWFVFQAGFKSRPVQNFPFILWLISAMLPWFFFSESLNGATNSITEYSYLVKKVVFRVSVLPLVKILSSLFVHLFFIVFIFVIFSIYGYFPNLYNLQFLYYLFAMIVLVTGLSWTTASLVVFVKDVGPLINVIIQMLFWVTPIFWSYSIMPKNFLVFLKLNPVFYITEGYRSSFIYHQWFWEHPFGVIYFWSFVLVTWAVGAVVFKRLRPHFADTL